MTDETPADQKPTFDPFNPYHLEAPVEWATSLVDTPAGQRAALCFRYPNTTATVVLTDVDLDALIATLTLTRGNMSPIVKPPSGIFLPNGYGPNHG